MANDVQVLDGFRYEVEEGALYNSDRGESKPIVILKLIDDARGLELHAYFGKQAFEDFKADLNGGVFIPNREAIEKLGI